MPLPVISIARMREWEKATWATGQTEREVIRRVGEALAQRAVELTGQGDLILILAGKGNNGQDAIGARAHLSGRLVDVLEVKDPGADLSKLEGLLAKRPALVMDGLFGVGINRPLSSEWIHLIERVNQTTGFVLAVDIPSGLNADTGEPQGAAVRADLTLTVGAPKMGMLQSSAWKFVGRLEVASDVGLSGLPGSGELEWTQAEDFSAFPPRRNAASHKGSYGHLAIVAGSPGYHGAAVLAARGAQRAQPGLVTLHTPGAAYVPVASQLQAVMVAPWSARTTLQRPWSAILAGPGLASVEVPEELKSAVVAAWRDSDLPVVVDASALDWLPAEAVRKAAVRVMTPHPGEAARLLGCSAAEVQANRLDAL